MRTKQIAKSREGRAPLAHSPESAESRMQRVESREQRAESREQRAEEEPLLGKSRKHTAPSREDKNREQRKEGRG